MKRNLLLFAFLTTALFAESQNALYTEVVSLIEKNHPELARADKLIAVNFWEHDDEESRRANQAFEKAMKVYEVAKLSGGSEGFLVVSISLDNIRNLSQEAFQNDGIVKLLPFNQSDLNNAKQSFPRNIVFNSNGVIVCQDLKPEAIFGSIQKLVTR